MILKNEKMVRPASRLSLDSGAVQGVVYNTLSILRQYDYTYQFIH